MLDEKRDPNARRAEGGTPSQKEYACVAGSIVGVSSTGWQMTRGTGVSSILSEMTPLRSDVDKRTVNGRRTHHFVPSSRIAAGNGRRVSRLAGKGETAGFLTSPACS